MVDRPNITVVLIAYHGDRWLPECVETLGRAAGESLRLVVVDNGGNSGLDGLALDRFDHVVLRTPRSLGFAEANNYALCQVPLDSEAVCFLNQDTRSGPGWLDACLDCLRSNEQIGAVSPLLRTYDFTGWDPGFRECVPEWCDSPSRNLENHSGSSGTAGFSHDPENCATFVETSRITAAAMVVRTEALLKTGPFDPIFGSYYEDYDLCRRMRGAGYRVGVCPQAEVAHYSGSATTTDSASRRRMRQVIRNRAILRIRESGPSRLRTIVGQFARTFPYNLCRGIARTASSQPPGVQIAAHWELLKVARRIVSERRDRRAWETYLSEIGWPGQVGRTEGTLKRQESVVPAGLGGRVGCPTPGDESPGYSRMSLRDANARGEGSPAGQFAGISVRDGNL